MFHVSLIININHFVEKTNKTNKIKGCLNMGIFFQLLSVLSHLVTSNCNLWLVIRVREFVQRRKNAKSLVTVQRRELTFVSLQRQFAFESHYPNVP